MSIGETLRTLVEINFPDHATREVSYSAKEAELRIKFNGAKSPLPSSERVGWLINETLKHMHLMGYDRQPIVKSSIEYGVKFTLSISARSNSKHRSQWETTQS